MKDTKPSTKQDAVKVIERLLLTPKRHALTGRFTAHGAKPDTSLSTGTGTETKK